MRFDWPDEMAAFRQEVRAYAERQSAADGVRWGDDDQDKLDAIGLHNREELDHRGWLRISWPKELGGEGRSPWYQFLLALEVGYHDVEYGRGGTASMIGPARTGWIPLAVPVVVAVFPPTIPVAMTLRVN